MTRICSYCKKVMGYKHSKCGDMLWPIPYDNESGYCETCDDVVKFNEGGTTHGICKECEGEMK